MRKAAALLAGLAILAVVNVGIYQRERLLADGRVVLLKLSPIDPRSLMQGDYMRLNFEVADQAFPGFGDTEMGDGHIVVGVDGRNIAHFRRFAGTEALGADELALRYRIRGGEPNFATNAYFFQEGRAAAYEKALYGEFRVAPDGEMILTRLRGPRLEVLDEAR